MASATAHPKKHVPGMEGRPDNPDCPICSPPAVAERRFTDMRRFLGGGVEWWLLLWHEHAEDVRGAAD